MTRFRTDFFFFFFVHRTVKSAMASSQFGKNVYLRGAKSCAATYAQDGSHGRYDLTTCSLTESPTRAYSDFRFMSINVIGRPTKVPWQVCSDYLHMFMFSKS